LIDQSLQQVPCIVFAYYELGLLVLVTWLCYRAYIFLVISGFFQYVVFFVSSSIQHSVYIILNVRLELVDCVNWMLETAAVNIAYCWYI